MVYRGGLSQHPSFMKPGHLMNKTINLTKKLAILSEWANLVLKHRDPGHYKEVCWLREKASNMFSTYHNLFTEDRLVYEGREVLWNRGSNLHMDSFDPPKAFAVITAFGNFTGGHLYMLNLSLRVRLRPGDAIAIRGRVIPHASEDWEDRGFLFLILLILNCGENWS